MRRLARHGRIGTSPGHGRRTTASQELTTAGTALAWVRAERATPGSVQGRRRPDGTGTPVGALTGGPGRALAARRAVAAGIDAHQAPRPRPPGLGERLGQASTGPRRDCCGG